MIQWNIDGIYPLVICYIAIENRHRNSEFSSKDGDFPVRYVTSTRGSFIDLPIKHSEFPIAM